MDESRPQIVNTGDIVVNVWRNENPNNPQANDFIPTGIVFSNVLFNPETASFNLVLTEEQMEEVYARFMTGKPDLNDVSYDSEMDLDFGGN